MIKGTIRLSLFVDGVTLKKTFFLQTFWPYFLAEPHFFLYHITIMRGGIPESGLHQPNISSLFHRSYFRTFASSAFGISKHCSIYNNSYRGCCQSVNRLKTDTAFIYTRVLTFPIPISEEEKRKLT